MKLGKFPGEKLRNLFLFLESHNINLYYGGLYALARNDRAECLVSKLPFRKQKVDVRVFFTPNKQLFR
jgi:hypothetical protein